MATGCTVTALSTATELIGVRVSVTCVCVDVQLDCARVLLFRGADKHVLNRTMFDAHRVACISQNKRIADLIEDFQDKDVGNVAALCSASRSRRNFN